MPSRPTADADDRVRKSFPELLYVWDGGMHVQEDLILPPITGQERHSRGANKYRCYYRYLLPRHIANRFADTPHGELRQANRRRATGPTGSVQ